MKALATLLVAIFIGVMVYFVLAHKENPIEIKDGRYLVSAYQEDLLTYYKITSSVIVYPESKDGKVRLKADLPLHFNKLEVRSCTLKDGKEYCSEPTYFQIYPSTPNLRVNK